MEREILEVDGEKYQIFSEEDAWSQLEKGGILEGIYLEKWTFGVNQPESPPEIFAQKIQLKNCRLGQVNFSGLHFQEEISFENVHFEKSLLLGNTRVDWANLESSQELPPNEFHKKVTFLNCHFEKMVDLTGSSFSDYLHIESCTFLGNLHLGKNYFGGTVTLRENTFFCQVILKGVTLEKSLIWSKNILKNKVKLQACSAENFYCKKNQFFNPFQMDQVSTRAGCHLAKNQFQEVKIFALFVGETFSFQGSHFQKAVKMENMEINRDLAGGKAIFEDSLSLRKSRVGEKFNVAGAQFLGATFLEELEVRGQAIFNGAVFGGKVSFKRSHFFQETLLTDGVFRGPVDFRFARIDGRSSFSAVVFEDKANFYRAQFSGPAYFLGTRFQEVDFVNTSFLEQVFFSFDRNTLAERNRQKIGGKEELALMFVSSFDGPTNFTNTLFYKKTIFENICFKEAVCFKGAYFNEKISFLNSHFLKEANFESVYCSMELNFTNGLFFRYVNFDYANINRRLNLSGTAIQGGISFFHSIIDVVVAERDQIEGQLVYEGRVKGKKDWLNYFKVKEEYLILKESYQQRGKFQEEDWAYYRYRVNDRRSLSKKALQSLLKREISESIVAESEEEGYEKVLKDVMVGYKRAHRATQKVEKNLAKLEEVEEAKSEEHQKYLESDEYLAVRETKIQTAKEELEQAVIFLAKETKEKEKIEEIIELDRKRWTALKKNQQSPYTTLGAFWRLITNAGWVLVDWSTGYGVKPFRIGLIALVLILVYSFCYLIPFLPPFADGSGASLAFVADTINFSALAFVTEVHEHPVLKEGIFWEFLVVSEAFLGLFFMTLFVGCYTRKIIR